MDVETLIRGRKVEISGTRRFGAAYNEKLLIAAEEAVAAGNTDERLTKRMLTRRFKLRMRRRGPRRRSWSMK